MGRHVLDHYVGLRDELFDKRHSLRSRQIQAHTKLVPVDVMEERVLLRIGLVANDRAPLTGRIQALHRFHLDHLGAEVRQNLPTHGTRPYPPEVDYSDSLEW